MRRLSSDKAVRFGLRPRQYEWFPAGIPEFVQANPNRIDNEELSSPERHKGDAAHLFRLTVGDDFLGRPFGCKVCFNWSLVAD